MFCSLALRILSSALWWADASSLASRHTPPQPPAPIHCKLSLANLSSVHFPLQQAVWSLYLGVANAVCMVLGSLFRTGDLTELGSSMITVVSLSSYSSFSTCFYAFSTAVFLLRKVLRLPGRQNSRLDSSLTTSWWSSSWRPSSWSSSSLLIYNFCIFCQYMWIGFMIHDSLLSYLLT